MDGDLMGGRVGLTPRPAPPRPAALETAMLGHLPGRVRLERLRPDARAAMRAAGLGEAVDHLDDLPVPRLRPRDIHRLRALHHLPIPLLSAAELDDIFPDCRCRPTGYRSILAGARAWLPDAVDDFFANGGERLWVLRIPQAEGPGGFLPRAVRAPAPEVLTLEDPLTLRGLAALLPLPGLAVIAAPDLERRAIPARLPDIPRRRLDNPEPVFAPCAGTPGEPPAERRRRDEMPGPPDPDEPAATLDALDRICNALARYRPDLQYLQTLPLAYVDAAGGPAPHAGLIAALIDRRDRAEGTGLRRVQFLYPYLRGPGRDLASPVGLVAGRQAGVARRAGVWRSMAGQALVTDAVPYPPLERRAAERLRDRPGIGCLVLRRGRVELEDERLAVPALHPDDWVGRGDPRGYDGYRSGEVRRFLGHLIRRLRALGEALIFVADPRDPRPRLLLEDLFRGLHAAGALRGALPEESYRIRPGLAGEGVIAYDIEIAPAFPIDRLRLTFVNRDGEWQAGPGETETATARTLGG